MEGTVDAVAIAVAAAGVTIVAAEIAADADASIVAAEIAAIASTTVMAITGITMARAAPSSSAKC